MAILFVDMSYICLYYMNHVCVHVKWMCGNGVQTNEVQRKKLKSLPHSLLIHIEYPFTMVS